LIGRQADRREIERNIEIILFWRKFIFFLMAALGSGRRLSF